MTDLLMPLPVILAGWALAGGSPGPATLAISAASMGEGRAAGLALALGVFAGSACWGLAAGLGFSALMVANVWLFEAVRIAGAAYLLYLAVKSLRSAWRGQAAAPAKPAPRRAFFLRGMLLHLTNPKAILAWGSVYAIALPPVPDWSAVWSLFAALSAVSFTVFSGYALMFSTPAIARAYARTRRAFDAGFGLLFGLASLKLLMARLT